MKKAPRIALSRPCAPEASRICDRPLYERPSLSLDLPERPFSTPQSSLVFNSCDPLDNRPVRVQVCLLLTFLAIRSSSLLLQRPQCSFNVLSSSLSTVLCGPRRGTVTAAVRVPKDRKPKAETQCPASNNFRRAFLPALCPHLNNRSEFPTVTSSKQTTRTYQQTQTMSRYGVLVMGPAGSGKSTFCSALISHLRNTKRGCMSATRHDKTTDEKL
ncbi:hypothetical protein BJ508DRAFT_97099 [Ascobolus immersus RN42]|uniref:Uncharacterized protein n=1 Tax=Ascobolus immersus RN42 TaxID=1160509 RepID=A0A3N4IM41_ASCIM|nr:hypothetical protein BJ508DRAFT_97099 [Ascobolus immersus RN42]